MAMVKIVYRVMSKLARVWRESACVIPVGLFGVVWGVIGLAAHGIFMASPPQIMSNLSSTTALTTRKWSNFAVDTAPACNADPGPSAQ